jgi:heme/copper-type cytochrome/quinol oxidase subunit 2
MSLAALAQQSGRDEHEPPKVRPFEQPPQIMQVSAGNFAFTPPVVHVKVGQNIQLQVTTTDKTHGIRISPFPDGASKSTPPGLEFLYGEDCWKIEKGETVRIEFVAHTAGTYSFTCCKQCGSGHKRMKGQIVAEP